MWGIFTFLYYFFFILPPWLNAFVVLLLSLPDASGPVRNWELLYCLIYSCSVMSWGISRIPEASRRSDLVSLLRPFPSFSMPIDGHKAAASDSGVTGCFFQLPFTNVGVWIFADEQGSLAQSLASSSELGSISVLHVAVLALMLFQSQPPCSHCQFLSWESCVSLITTPLFKFLFWSMETYLVFETDNILQVFFLKLNFKM